MAIDFEKIIHDVETAFDVDKIKYDDIQLWPFIRHEIFVKYESNLYHEISFGNKNNLKSVKNSIWSKVKLAYQIVKQTWFPYLLKKNPVLLYTNFGETIYVDRQLNLKISNELVKIEDNIVPIFIPDEVKKLKNSFDKYICIDFICFFFLFFKQAINLDLLEGKNILDKICSFLNISYDLEDRVKYILKAIWAYEKWFTYVKPKKIYVICYYSLSYLPAFYVAKKLGIPIIEMQHGSLGAHHYAYSSFKSMSDNPFPNYLFSFGEQYKKNISSYIYPKEKIKIVGFNFIEQTRSHKDENKIAFFTKYPELIGKVIITVAGEPDIDRQIFDFFIKVAELHDDIYIVYVPRFLEAYHTQTLTNMYIETELNVYQCMQNSSITAGVYTTCMVESLALGVPALLVNIHGMINSSYLKLYDGIKAYRVVDESREVLVAVKELLEIDEGEVIKDGDKFYAHNHRALLEKAIKEVENDLVKYGEGG